MRLKTKLYSVIMAFCLMLSLLAVGVWAVNSGTVNIGGTVSFIATDIYATITGKVEGATTTPTLSTLNYSATGTPTQDELNTWSRDLEFAKTTTPTIKWTVTIQNKSERVLYVSLTDNMTSITNVTKSMTYDGATYTSGEKAIPAGTTKVFTMTAVVNDTNKKASAVYDYAFDLRDANSDLAPDQGEEGGSNVDLKYDADAGYYYVEMGTYNNSAVRWKLVGVDGAKFTGSSVPASGTTGTFILETYVDKTKAFESTGSYNDYSTSTVRDYLNGEYITELNLTNDATYNAITAREITDLHTDIGWATVSSSIGAGNQWSPPAGTTQYATYDTTPKSTEGADKLWLMSVKEIYTMVGGGTIGADGTIPSNWSTYCDNLIWNEEYYWLRSPRPHDSDYAFAVNDLGDWYSTSVYSTRAVRPAFNLVLGGGSSVEDDTPVNAEAVSYLTFTVIDEQEKCVEVSGVRENGVWLPTGEIEIPAYIELDEVVYKVTSIADYAFTDQVIVLTQAQSFVNTGTMDFDALVTAGAQITKVILPDTITNIGVGAFTAVMSLKEINMPQSLTTLGDIAFAFTTSLIEIEFQSLPECAAMFFDMASPFIGGALETLTIHSGDIVDGCFMGVTSIKTVSLGNGVTSIGESAFQDCTSLTSITIPDSVEAIGDSAFRDCTGLTNVTIGSGVTSIGGQAFYGCTGLTSITIPDSVKSIGASAFQKCTGLTSITIPDGVTSIGSYAFYNCTGLTNVTIGSGVTSIEYSAFYGCTGLTNVTIGSGVTSIGGQAFQYCTELTSITIPDGVEAIGSNAFYGCTNLAEVNVKATNVPTGGAMAFDNCSSSLVIYVPTASVSAYQTTGYWRNYSNQIQGKSF